jgi:hypothetical protein
MPWRGPKYPGEMPTLGYEVLDWMGDMLAAPDRTDGEMLVLTREQAQFILNFYAVDPRTGRRRYRRGVLSRPKGWGKVRCSPPSPALRRWRLSSQMAGMLTASP